MERKILTGQILDSVISRLTRDTYLILKTEHGMKVFLQMTIRL